MTAHESVFLLHSRDHPIFASGVRLDNGTAEFYSRLSASRYLQHFVRNLSVPTSRIIYSEKGGEREREYN